MAGKARLDKVNLVEAELGHEVPDFNQSLDEEEIFDGGDSENSFVSENISSIKHSEASKDHEQAGSVVREEATSIKGLIR